MNKNYQKYGYIEGWLSVIVNTLLFGFKYYAGIMTGSIAIIADAWHTLSDSLTSLIVIVGTKVAGQPADEEHPFGHGRIELIATVIIGVILGVVGFNILVDSIGKLKIHEPAVFGKIAVIATVTSIVVKELLAQYAIRTGKKIDSKPLIADGWHHRSDSISSIIVLVGIFFGQRFWWIDGVMGILVSLMLFYATFKILKSSINPLMGETPDPDIVIKLKEISNRIVGKDTHLHHIHFHRYGRHTEISFHIRLDPDQPLCEAHKVADRIETTVNTELEMDATIHVEPELTERK